MAFALIVLLAFLPANTVADTWNCTNTIEIRCDSDGCEAEKNDAFTPMSVSFNETGKMSVCAYSGCWEGSGEVFKDGDFLVLTGTNLKFSTASDDSMNQNILIALDKDDNIAVLKAGGFSHPLVCKEKK